MQNKTQLNKEFGHKGNTFSPSHLEDVIWQDPRDEKQVDSTVEIKWLEEEEGRKEGKDGEKRKFWSHQNSKTKWKDK